MFLSNMTWLAAIRHSDDGNYIAEVPQTSVNPCPLYQDCLRLYVSQRWMIISPVWIVLSCPERVLSALFDRSATVTAIHSLNSITARSTAAIRKVANNLGTTGMDSLTSVGPRRCNYHRLNDGSPPANNS